MQSIAKMARFTRFIARPRGKHQLL